MSKPLVQLRGVSKTFGIFKALSDVTFDLPEGEVFGYIGPNGAGKTTTMKILAGLISKFDGELTIGGRKGKRRADLHDLIGFVPQSAGFQNWRTVESALATLGTLSGVESTLLKKRMDELLERFDLIEHRHKKVKTLSGGMAQKLGLIQALLHEPKLLILDEPLAGLDPVSRRLVKQVVRERRDAGTTVIFSSHILSDLQDVADRVGILDDGKIVEIGTLPELVKVFGLPIDVALEFSVVPASVDFVEADAAVEHATERRHGDWLLRLTDGADLDAVVHRLIEATLAGGGQLRAIGSVEPNLDELYAKFIARDGQSADA